MFDDDIRVCTDTLHKSCSCRRIHPVISFECTALRVCDKHTSVDLHLFQSQSSLRSALQMKVVGETSVHTRLFSGFSCMSQNRKI